MMTKTTLSTNKKNLNLSTPITRVTQETIKRLKESETIHFMQDRTTSSSTKEYLPLKSSIGRRTDSDQLTHLWCLTIKTQLRWRWALRIKAHSQPEWVRTSSTPSKREHRCSNSWVDSSPKSGSTTFPSNADRWTKDCCPALQTRSSLRTWITNNCFHL